MTDTNTELPQTKKELLIRIRREWSLLERTVSGIDQADMNKTGADGWSIKDHLVHLTVWQRWLLLHHFEGRPVHEVMDIDPDEANDMQIDQLNEIIWRRYHDQDPTTVWTELRNTYAQVMATLEEMPYKEMLQARYLDRPEAGPLLNWIIGNTYEHFDEHMAAIMALAHADQ